MEGGECSTAKEVWYGKGVFETIAFKYVLNGMQCDNVLNILPECYKELGKIAFASSKLA